MEIFKSLLFVAVLIYAGIYDYKKRIIPDKVHVIIILSALLTGFYPGPSILGLLVLPIPFIIPIFFNEESIGGGDIKLVGPIGFYLGVTNGLLAIVIGLFLSTLVSILFKRHKNELVPLAPYLATGSIIVLFSI